MKNFSLSDVVIFFVGTLTGFILGAVIVSVVVFGFGPKEGNDRAFREMVRITNVLIRDNDRLERENFEIKHKLGLILADQEPPAKKQKDPGKN